MTKQIDQQLFVEQVNALLQETFEKVGGIYLDRATSLFETLETLSAEEASHPITEGGTCIISQVQHVRFYLKVLNDYLEGKPADNADWKSSWLTKTASEAEWNSLKQLVKDDYKSLQARLANFDDWNQERRLGGSLAIIVHTAYHLGAIRQIARVVKSS